MKTITVLGSTGSIGTNTLDVAARFPGRYRVHGLAVRANIGLLRRQIAAFRPAAVAVYEPGAAAELRASLPTGANTAVLEGLGGLEELAADGAVDQVVSGMVGAVGLMPTFAAIAAGKQVAIANKETLVLAGELMVERAAASGSVLLPMDSEHNAIFQCLGSRDASAVERIVLTASGGPFRDLSPLRFPEITREQALAHPNWKMGPKITIDSATMLNKGLEVIEARWLFGVPPERIDVLIHRQSIVHSLVQFVDGSVLAQLGLPDMRTPIAYCLSHPERLPLELPRLNLAQVGRLEFEEVSAERYPALFLALEALARGGGAPAVLNGANEAVVAAYLAQEFPFPEIAGILGQVMTALDDALRRPEAPPCLARLRTVDDALAADRWGRETAQSFLGNLRVACC